MKNFIKLFLIIFFITACNTYNFNLGHTGGIFIGVKWPAIVKPLFKIQDIPANTSKIRIKIKSNDWTITEKYIIRPENTIRLKMIPTGEKDVEAEALDEQNTVLAKGMKTVTVIEDTLTTVEITLQPVEYFNSDGSPVPKPGESGFPNPGESGSPGPKESGSPVPKESATPKPEKSNLPHILTSSGVENIASSPSDYRFTCKLNESLKFKQENGRDSVWLELYNPQYPKSFNYDMYSIDSWYRFQMNKTSVINGYMDYIHTETIKFQDITLLYRFVYILADNNVYFYYPGIENETPVNIGTEMPGKTSFTGASFKIEPQIDSEYYINIEK